MQFRENFSKRRLYIANSDAIKIASAASVNNIYGIRGGVEGEGEGRGEGRVCVCARTCVGVLPQCIKGPGKYSSRYCARGPLCKERGCRLNIAGGRINRETRLRMEGSRWDSN